MGVHGLWRLIEPSGKPVPLETLENKILAVDISIWLHQAIKGFQDSRGAPLPNAHLLGIYHRVCKLLYFRIKPVFVFDGGVPALKKQTIAKRNQQKTRILNDASNIQKKILQTLLKHSAVNKVIADKTDTSPPRNKYEENDNNTNMYILPEVPATELNSTFDSDESSLSCSPPKQWDLHTIDEKSEHFKSLPADVRHEILTDIMETRKQSSWGRIHELPTESNDFSKFQMNRLLKRFSVQSSLEEAIQEMGGHSLSLGELEALLNEEGIVTTSETGGKRIASDSDTRYLLIKDVQKAMENAKKQQEKSDKKILETIEEEENEKISSNDKEYERDLAAAIQLSLQDQPSTSKDISQQSILEFSFLENFNDGDFDSDSEEEPVTTKITRLEQAKSYMLEYSGLTPNEIDKIINKNKEKPLQTKKDKSKKINASKSEDQITEISSSNTSEVQSISEKIMQETITSTNTEEISSSKQIPEPEKSVKNMQPVELSDSDEDSDFIEVNSSSDQIESKMKPDTKPSLEILINPKENMEDDIFSDIFAEKEPELKIQNNPEMQQSEKNSNNEIIDSTTKSLLLNNENSKIEVEKKNEIIFAKPALSVEDLNKMKSDLAQEQQELIMNRNVRERMAGNITDQMYQEAQELLEIFGVPYIIAPMEAEAQCAFLNEINLTDGTITDDSDIWLFGGKTVYKNFFNQNKHVLEFRAERIEHHFKLTREQLILLAMLVGSDYTVGIQGIGPVTALEILAAFPPARHTNVSVLTQTELISGLNEFKKWLFKDKTTGTGKLTLRSKLRNIDIHDGFPSLQVVQAYLQPEVETCRDTFTWNKPDIVGLIDFAKEKFGWTKLKSEEILKPVIKKMEDKNIQKSIRDYFTTKHKIEIDAAESKMSKRVKSAVKRIGNKTDNTEDTEKPTKTTSKSKNTRKRKNEETNENDASTTKTVLPKKQSKESKETSKKEPKQKSITRKPKQLHTKECIPQRERDKINALKNKLKAIEVFRKSKAGPGYVKKRQKTINPLKEEADLSESSSSD